MKTTNVNKMNTKVRINPLVSLLSLICALNFYACTPEDDPTEPDVNCLAMPTCGPGQVEVEQCDESLESCDEVSMCGVTLFCAEEGSEDLPEDGVCLAAPVCAMDEIEVEACEEEDENCYESTICEMTIYCTSDASGEDGEDGEDGEAGEDGEDGEREKMEKMEKMGKREKMEKKKSLVESVVQIKLKWKVVMREDSCQEVSICEQSIFCADSAE